jgi:hypothetical protein
VGWRPRSGPVSGRFAVERAGTVGAQRIIEQKTALAGLFVGRNAVLLFVGRVLGFVCGTRSGQAPTETEPSFAVLSAKRIWPLKPVSGLLMTIQID